MQTMKAIIYFIIGICFGLLLGFMSGLTSTIFIENGKIKNPFAHEQKVDFKTKQLEDLNNTIQ